MSHTFALHLLCCACSPFLLLPAKQARAFVAARSRGQLESFASAVARAINEADDQDAVVQVRGDADTALHCWF